MRRWLPVLFVIMGLGIRFSSAQDQSPKTFSDPFDRYLKGVKAANPEPSLRRFAGDCGVDLAKLTPRFAVSVGESWTVVRNLASGLKNLESDFYTTAEVWTDGKDSLVEMWPNSDDVGSEVRILRCFIGGKLQIADTVQWNVPVEQDPKLRAWGYSQRWERGADGQVHRVRATFVDEYERTIPKPRLDSDGEKSLRWSPPMGPLNQLGLPPKFLH